MASPAKQVMIGALTVALVLGAILGLGLFSRHGGTRPVGAHEDARAAIVQSFFDAGNSGDVDGELALFTSDALFIPTSVFQGGAPCGPAAPCQGAALCNLFQQQAGRHLVRTLTDLHVSGSVVSGRFEEANDAARAAGQRDLTSFIAEVPNDKISAFVVMLDVTDPETADFALTQTQSQPAPASAACAGAGTPGSSRQGKRSQ